MSFSCYFACDLFEICTPTCYDLVCLMVFCVFAVFVSADVAYWPLCHSPVKQMVQVLVQVQISYLFTTDE